jgi:YD repeat-containing protein
MNSRGHGEFYEYKQNLSPYGEKQQNHRTGISRYGAMSHWAVLMGLGLMLLCSSSLAAQTVSAPTGSGTPVTLKSGGQAFLSTGPTSAASASKRGIKADLDGPVAVTNYFSQSLFSEIPTSVLNYNNIGWFVMHDCCNLTFLDDPPETYTFSSPCTKNSIFTTQGFSLIVPQPVTISSADNIAAQDYYNSIGDPGPYYWDEWWMQVGFSAVGWVDQPTTCAINAYNNGQLVATASVVVPPSKAPSSDPGDPTAPCDPCNASDPISLQTGNVSITQTDIRLPGLGGGLTLTRSWNSKLPATGMFGYYWRSTYEERVDVNQSGGMNNVQYHRGDGSFWTFVWNNSGTGYQLVSPANAGASFTAGGSFSTITFKNGERRLFSNGSGNLAAIIDRNGNTTQLAYDAQGRLTTVVDPANRHLYFSYSPVAAGTSMVVTKVTTDVGISLSYTYDPVLATMQTVTKPDGTNIYFQYQGGFISAVLDTNGKTIETHTYDQYGRGLTSSRANGVEGVSMAYPN